MKQQAFLSASFTSQSVPLSKLLRSSRILTFLTAEVIDNKLMTAYLKTEQKLKHFCVAQGETSKVM